MTVFEHLQRRNARRSKLCIFNDKTRSPEERRRRRRGDNAQQKITPSKRVHDVITKRLRQNYERLGRKRRQRMERKEAAKQKPRLDVVTTHILQTEVLKLIQQSHGYCTVSSMATILSSQEIEDSHCSIVAALEDYDEYDDYENDCHHSLLVADNDHHHRVSKTKAKERLMTRKYQLWNAMHTLQQGVGASRTGITSWEEAQKHFSSVVTFPPSTAGGAILATTGMVAGKDQQQEEEEDSIEKYRKRFEDVRLEQTERKVGLSTSQRLFQQMANATLSNELEKDRADQILEDRLEKEYAQREERSKSDAVKEVDAALKQKERDEEAKKRASALMRPLTDEEAAIVKKTLYEIGPEADIVAQEGPDSIQRVSIQRLRPGTWLNDEVIHFFYVMLSKRDADLCQADPTKKRSHFFKSFFMTKLLNEGHKDPNMDGAYEYKNVKRWSKKVPGKDIFNLDKIFFPINVGGTHWICAVIFMLEKKIQMYDSFGSPGDDYLQHLFQYLKDEHLDKKKTPLPDPEEWTLVQCERDTPRQANCDDCGVFTCMFADFISMGYPLSFNQSHITQCRERIALSIMKGKAIV